MRKNQAEQRFQNCGMTLTDAHEQIRKGRDSVRSESGWVSEAETPTHFGIGVEAE